jgi:glycosyltransferase involved in cell wall biosynthesis
VVTARAALMSRRKPLEGLRICHFGHFSPNYSRNRIMRKALMRAGAVVVDAFDDRRYVLRTPTLVRRGFQADCDVILVGFPGHADVGAARVVSWLRRSPVILDALTSLWEAAVSDRSVTDPRSLNAVRYRLEDRLACSLADLVLLDTAAHCAYFSDDLSVSQAKLRVVPVGADEDVMRPQPSLASRDPFRVFFYGSFIPLHGVEHIVEAAYLLERAGTPIEISLVGAGQTRHAVERRALELGVANVHFMGERPYESLPPMMGESDVCLGIFGTTPKAARVVPNKIFDALACRRAVITRDGPAVREWFTDREDVWLCPPGDPEALAEAIAHLRSDGQARERVAQAGHELFRRRFSLDALAGQMTEVVEEVLLR